MLAGYKGYFRGLKVLIFEWIYQRLSHTSGPGAPEPPNRDVLHPNCFEQIDDRMFVVLIDSDRVRVERFKQLTRDKLRGVRCPHHHQPPRIHFRGESLRDTTISLTGCCERLMELANARIAMAPATPAPGSAQPLREMLPRASAG